MQNQEIRLIIRGDDMGYTHAANEAIIRCYREGIMTSVEVLVASPWFPEAVKLLQNNAGLDVGIHLDLTCEWDNLKWKSLTHCPSLTDSNGYFYPMVYPNPNYPGQSLMEIPWKIEEIEREFRAQIELGLKRIPHASHISSHMNCTRLSPGVESLTKRLAQEYQLDIDPAEYSVIDLGYGGATGTPEEKINSFIKTLNTLEPGKTYLFVDHPGLDNHEMQGVHHIGYENVAVDRQGVTDLFTSKEVRNVIEEKGIRLIGYKDLKSKKESR